MSYSPEKDSAIETTGAFMGLAFALMSGLVAQGARLICGAASNLTNGLK